MRRTGFDAVAGNAPEDAPRGVPVPIAGAAALESLDALVAAEFSRIRRLAIRFGLDAHEAEDAAQEVFTKAWMHRARFQGASRVTTWLTRIAINEFSTRVRKQRRWSRIAEQLPRRPVQSQGDPRHRLDASAAHDKAAECLARLPAKQRDAFVLRYLEHMTCAEAAEILGVSEGVVRARSFSARKSLRTMLGDWNR